MLHINGCKQVYINIYFMWIKGHSAVLVKGIVGVYCRRSNVGVLENLLNMEQGMPCGCRAGPCMDSMVDGRNSFSARLLCARNSPELWVALNCTSPQAALGSIWSSEDKYFCPTWCLLYLVNEMITVGRIFKFSCFNSQWLRQLFSEFTCVLKQVPDGQ